MDNQVIYSINKNLEAIPFVEIIHPYTHRFLDDFEIKLSDGVKEKLHLELVKELSALAEIILQQALDSFILAGNDQMESFITKMNQSLAEDFSVLDSMIKKKVSDFSHHIYNILNRFNKDYENIKAIFNLNEVKIVDVDANLGDGHNGEGTALIYLSNGTKLVYKPRNVN